MSQKFLYGAAVQGIQQYIFDTNKLKDIVGASVLVEEICTEMFNEYGNDKNKSVVRAAGNIKYIFDSEEQCRKTVREFPRKVLRLAKGVTISQAVEKFDDNELFSEVVDRLERKLRTARNRPGKPVDIGLMAIERSRNTGRPVVTISGDEHLDGVTCLKREKSKGAPHKLSEKAFGLENIQWEELPLNIEDITNNNSWIAIVHADGNGLGKIVQKIGANKDVFSAFSRSLDEATRKAANDAFDHRVRHKIKIGNVIPMRPIVLGGDDFTFVIRGDIAVDFTKEFLVCFEKRTKELFEKHLVKPYSHQLSEEQKKILQNGLTACAGISFVKESYPFYYGYNLAEGLCSEAKKEAKKKNSDLAPSCLMFHKVQDSFILDFNDIKKRELTPCKGMGYEFGPYYISEQPGKWDVDTLLCTAELLTGENGNAIKSCLRKWLTTVSESGIDAAKQYGERIKDIHPESLQILNLLLDCSKGVSPVYDVLSLSSIMHIITK